MVYSELIDLIQKKDTGARRQWFDTFYSRLAAIALRYAKNEEQAEAMIYPAMHKCYEKLEGPGASNDLNESEVIRSFIEECVKFIKEIRSEYYVSSTVHATAPTSEALNLFENQPAPDLSDVSLDVLLPALQKLVPSQRLIYNLHVIDGFNPADAAALLESSEATIKSNLEKARYNLQKNVEKNLLIQKS